MIPRATGERILGCDGAVRLEPVAEQRAATSRARKRSLRMRAGGARLEAGGARAPRWHAPGRRVGLGTTVPGRGAHGTFGGMGIPSVTPGQDVAEHDSPRRSPASGPEQEPTA
jgi:hypothetical protein